MEHIHLGLGSEISIYIRTLVLCALRLSYCLLLSPCPFSCVEPAMGSEDGFEVLSHSVCSDLHTHRIPGGHSSRFHCAHERCGRAGCLQVYPSFPMTYTDAKAGSGRPTETAGSVCHRVSNEKGLAQVIGTSLSVQG